MEFAGSPMPSKRARPAVRRPLAAALDARRPYDGCNLYMYVMPPTETISLMEMEEFALWRLQVLRSVERCRERSAKLGPAEFKRLLGAELHRLNYLLDGYANDSSFVDGASAKAGVLADARRRDYISHFVLRLPFCKSPDMQRWFIQQEVELFKYRFANETSESAITAFLEQNGLHFDLVQEDVKQHMIGKLRAAANNWATKGYKLENEPFWQIDFREALDLVKGRKVYLSQGKAFVPRTDMSSIVVGRFRTNLAHGLASAARHFDAVLCDERLASLVQRMDTKTYVGKDYVGGAGSHFVVTPGLVDDLCATSFPLCMRSLHGELRRSHHLRHGGRMQYGLFLKGIGMPLDAAMDFWRDEFTKLIDADKFEKQYGYNIRHNYGKEGKRTDYTPYTCMKIITGSAPAHNDCHGCPFKHWDGNSLRDHLAASGMAADRVHSVLAAAAAGHYDRACTRHFEAVHKVADGGAQSLIDHPNRYFELSRKIRDGSATHAQKSQLVQSQMSQSQEQACSSMEH